ncbi:phage tail assembly protein T [Robbsia andropogonis]
MWFRLALSLGSTVSELQARMSSDEFGEWLAFYSIEPFGPAMDDVRMGTVASTVANFNRAPNTDPFKPSDFAPWLLPPPEKKAPPSAEAVAVAVFGVPLAELKAKGTRTFTLSRPKHA